MQTLSLLRRKLGFTQIQVANILNINPSTVAKWETGKSVPRAEKLLELAALLGCTTDFLLGAETPIYGQIAGETKENSISPDGKNPASDC